jgi:hypothetical protein
MPRRKTLNTSDISKTSPKDYIYKSVIIRDKLSTYKTQSAHRVGGVAEW